MPLRVDEEGWDEASSGYCFSPYYWHCRHCQAEAALPAKMSVCRTRKPLALLFSNIISDAVWRCACSPIWLQGLR